MDASEEHAFTRSGTLDYMAPEVLANPTTDLHEGPYLPLATLQEHGVKPYNDKVDIWAVGILSYELVVGRPPFEVENEQYTMRLIMNSNRITYPIQFSKEWADFVSLTLNKKPDMRPSAAKLLQHPWILKHVPRDGMKDGGECPTSLNVQNGVAAGSVTQVGTPMSSSIAGRKMPCSSLPGGL